MAKIKTKLWQKKAIEIYSTHICDISYDHISVGFDKKNGKDTFIYDIHELGYEDCPVCKKLAPIVNFNFHHPDKLIKMCECGYENEVNKPDLFKSFCRSQ